MPRPNNLVPEGEKTWEMIQAAFAQTDKIMAERGWNTGAIDQEYLRRVVDRLWTDDLDREPLKAKARAAISHEVDALFDSIGDANRDEADDATASQQIDSLIPIAKEARDAGVAAYRETLAKIGDAGAAGFAWMSVAAKSKNKLLIRSLAEIGLGDFHTWYCDYRVNCHGLLPPEVERVQSISVQEAGLRAFSDRMNTIGFAVTVETQVD